MDPIRVLICDDSALMRRSLKKIIESDRKLTVVGAARDGEDAVVKARELNPDVITMDVNMPVMDGITALQIIVGEEIAPVLMVSSLTQEGAEATFEAMALGAFDYVSKPGGTVSVKMDSVAAEIVEKIKAAARPGVTRRLARVRDRRRTPSTAGRTPKRTAERTSLRNNGRSEARFKAVAIGVSTGGPKTLMDILPFLPADLPAAVFLVQHMPGQFITPYAKRLDGNCPMRVVEVSPGMEAEPGTVYIGKGGHHLMPYQRPDGRIQIRTPKKPVHDFMPSVDVMMGAVLKVFGADTVGVLLTGMGRDGAESMVEIRKAGGITIAESEESAIVFGMPGEAIARNGAVRVAPCWKIADEIIAAVER